MLSIHKTLLVVAVEATEAHYNSSGTAIPIESLELTPMEAELSQNTPLNSRLGSNEISSSGFRGRVAFRLPTSLPKVSGNLPPYHPLLQACGFEASESDETQVYTLQDQIEKTLSLTLFLDGVQHRLVGCRGNVRFLFGVHQRPIGEYEFLGLWNQVSDQSLPQVDFSAFTDPVILDADNTTVTFGQQEIPALSYRLDCGNQLDFSETLNQRRILLSNRRVEGQIRFHAGTMASFNPYSVIQSNSPHAEKVAIAFPESRAMSLEVPLAQWHSHALGSDKDLWLHQVSVNVGFDRAKPENSPITLKIT